MHQFQKVSNLRIITRHSRHFLFLFFLVNVMHFRKSWLRVTSVNFDFNAKSSSTDIRLNKPSLKSLAHDEIQEITC